MIAPPELPTFLKLMAMEMRRLADRAVRVRERDPYTGEWLEASDSSEKLRAYAAQADKYADEIGMSAVAVSRGGDAS